MDSKAISASELIDGLSVGYLKFTGLWSVINDYRTTGRRNKVMTLISVFMMIMNLPYITCQFTAYFFIKVDVKKASAMSIHAVGCLQLYARYFIFWVRLDSQCRIFNLFSKYFLTSIPENKQEKAKEIYKKLSAKTNGLRIASVIVNIFIVIIAIANPIFPVDYIQNHTGSMAAVTWGRKKILGGWYPLPMGETPYYELIFGYEILVHLWNSGYLSVFVTLYFQPLMCLYGHFTVLGYHISTLKADGTSTRKINTKNSNSAIYRELYAISQDHEKLLRYTAEIRNVYNPLVTMILAMGIMILITTIFQVLFGGVTDPVLLLEFIFFLGFQGIEVAMFCYASSLVEDASSNLSLCIYTSEWYRADIKYRRTAQMVMVGASRGMTLTAIRMYPVNMETMMSIFQFTYTAAALLSRMAD